jgi:hypothetical protein
MGAGSALNVKTLRLELIFMGLFYALGNITQVVVQSFKIEQWIFFYSYIYWSYLYSAGKVDEGGLLGGEALKEAFTQELAYAVLIEYFSLGLGCSNFIRCWKVARKVYGQKIPIVQEILDAAMARYHSFGERTDLKRAFLRHALCWKIPQKMLSVEFLRVFIKDGMVNYGE